MAKNSNIAWTTHTFNPWIGCTKVSPGCKNCYAETLDKNRFSKTVGGGTKDKPISHWGKGAPRYRTSTSLWNQPRKWNTEVEAHPDYRARVFPSLLDWLDEEAPAEWLADFLELIHETPNLDWLLLTKRPKNFEEQIACASENLHPEGNIASEWLSGRPPENVWIGVSVEDQKRADERIPQLLRIPAKVRFLSVEPLLGPVDLKWIENDGYKLNCLMGRQTDMGRPCEDFGAKVDWVIVGGESGAGRRDCTHHAIENVAMQCQAGDVPVFVKQDCAAKPGLQGRISNDTWSLKQFPTN